jgi:hypothetical protein
MAMSSETKSGFICEIWHASKIRIQSGSVKTFLRLPQDAQSETARFNGHTACVLSVGTELSYSIDEDGGFYDVKFDVETKNYPEFEDSTVVEWHPSTRSGGCGYGFARRGCAFGCRVYTREDDCVTFGVLKVGTEINHAVEEQSDGRVKANRISIYVENKED